MEKADNIADKAQENDIRSKNNRKNLNIYKYFKEEEIAQLTDEEFEILQAKANLPHLTTSASFRASFVDFYESYEGNDFKPGGLDGDATRLNVFKRLIAANLNYFPCFYRYARIFSLCRALGAANIYDIGCGSQLQAFLLMYAPEMNYTGIDPYIFEDYPDNFFPEPAYINELFEQFNGSGKIKYIKEAYPCDLAVAENNIATCISVGVIGSAVGDEKRENIVEALKKDFERILLDVPFREFNSTGINIKDIIYNEAGVWVNPFEKYYSLWKNAMPGFEFYRIGERNFILGTKIAGDRERLEKRYALIDDRVMTGAIDISWHQELMK